MSETRQPDSKRFLSQVATMHATLGRINAEIDDDEDALKVLNKSFDRFVPFAEEAMAEFEANGGVGQATCERGMLHYAAIREPLRELLREVDGDDDGHRDLIILFAQLSENHGEALFFVFADVNEGNKWPWDC